MPIAPILIAVLESLFKYAPSAISSVRELLSKADPKPEDWDILRAKLEAMEYSNYVPDSRIPKP